MRIPGSLLRRRKGTSRHAAHAARRPISSTSPSSSAPGDGVEAYLEPRTTVTDTTVVLVAATGEWTRRRVDGPDGAAVVREEARDPALRRRQGRLSAADARLDRAPQGRGHRLPMTCRVGAERHRHVSAAASCSTAAMIVRTPAPVPPFGRVAVRRAGVERRPGDVEVHPRQPVRHELGEEPAADEHAGPTARSARSSMSATGESSPGAVRRAAASPRPPRRRRCPRPRPRRASPARPSRRSRAVPSATSCAPVSVDNSIRRSGSSSAARVIASARTSRPSASVSATSTVLPSRSVRTSEGRYDDARRHVLGHRHGGGHRHRQLQRGDARACSR